MRVDQSLEPSHFKKLAHADQMFYDINEAGDALGCIRHLYEPD